MPYGTVDTRFDAWLQRIQLSDSNGDPATVNWHQKLLFYRSWWA
jgi:hypothetical protein